MKNVKGEKTLRKETELLLAKAFRLLVKLFRSKQDEILRFRFPGMVTYTKEVIFNNEEYKYFLDIIIKDKGTIYLTISFDKYGIFLSKDKNLGYSEDVRKFSRKNFLSSINTWIKESNFLRKYVSLAIKPNEPLYVDYKDTFRKAIKSLKAYNKVRTDIIDRIYNFTLD